MKSIKQKIYHKLINNEVRYNTKSLVRYAKNSNKITGNLNTNKISQLEQLKNQINSIKNCDLKKKCNKFSLCRR